MAWTQGNNLALGSSAPPEVSYRHSPQTRASAREWLVGYAKDQEELDMLLSMLGLYIDDRDIEAGFGVDLPKMIDGEIRTKHKTYPPPIKPA